VQEKEIHHFFDVQNSHTRGTENLPLDLKATMVPTITAQAKREWSCTFTPTHVFMAPTGRTLPMKNKSCGI
jgi:hypothetical protein